MVATIATSQLTVGKREFLQFPNRYLTQLTDSNELVVTNHGVQEYIIRTYAYKVATNGYKDLISNGNVATRPAAMVENVATRRLQDPDAWEST